MLIFSGNIRFQAPETRKGGLKSLYVTLCGTKAIAIFTEPISLKFEINLYLRPLWMYK